MASAFAAPFVALCLATTALQLFSFLDHQQPGGGPTTAPAQQASLLHSAAEVMPPLAAAAALFSSFAFIHHRLSHAAAAAPAAGAGNRRLSGLVFFVLCVSAGTLVFILFVRQDAGTGADHGAQAALRSLGLAALRTLPAAAAGTFFLGMTTLVVVIAHVRAGGEGGGGDAVAGDGRGPIQAQGPGRLLNKLALGVAAALAVLMITSLYGATS